MKTVVSMWGEHGDRPEPASVNDSLFGAFKGSATVEVACPPLAAWRLVTAVERIGEFSPQCIGARWIGSAAGPSVGARFEGTNRVVDEANDSEYIWIRPCTVTTAQPPERFSYTVGDRYDGTPATSWDIEIAPTEAGCRITEHFQHHPRGLSGVRHWADDDPARAEDIVNEEVQSLTNGVMETLQRMKRVLESMHTSDAMQT
jgi:uncharacterized protein YndB with AHSA1/START domain